MRCGTPARHTAFALATASCAPVRPAPWSGASAQCAYAMIPTADNSLMACRVGLQAASAASGLRCLRHRGGAPASTPTGRCSASLRSPCLAGTKSGFLKAVSHLHARYFSRIHVELALFQIFGLSGQVGMRASSLLARTTHKPRVFLIQINGTGSGSSRSRTDAETR
jgi:hypothetical protein